MNEHAFKMHVTDSRIRYLLFESIAESGYLQIKTSQTESLFLIYHVPLHYAAGTGALAMPIDFKLFKFGYPYNVSACSLPHYLH